MVIDVSDSTIKNNIITNVGTSISATNFNDVSGLALAGNQNTLINNTIENCQAPAGNPASGLQFGYQNGGSYARNTVIKDCYFNGNEINIRAEDTSGPITNVTIENSTLVQDGDTQYDFYLNNDAHLTTLNTTFEKTSTNIVDVDSTLTVKWHLNVNVQDGAVGYDGAEVYVQNLLGKDEPASQPMITKTIDTEAGWVKWIALTEYIEDSITRTYHTDHWVNVSAGSKGGLATPNMVTSQSIVIDLNDIPEILDLKRGRNSVYRADTVYLFVNATDGETSENLLDPIFEYREPNDYGWNTSYFGSEIWDPAGFWKIPFTPPIGATIGYHDIRARVQDEYGLYSPWETFLNVSAVDVMNNPPYGEDMYSITFTTAPDGAIYRGDHSWIYGDGEDVEDGDDENFQAAEFQYKRPSEAWGAHTDYWTGSPEKGSGDWFQDFEPDAFIDTPVGIYQFRVRFQDMDDVWSQWMSLEDLDVLNFPPGFNSFWKQSSSVYRENTVRIKADVYDREESEQDLEVHFYYKHALDTVWEDTWLSPNGLWSIADQDFYADFNPPDTATLGLYEFRIDITDHNSPTEDGATISFYPSGTAINVLNNIPTTIDVKMSSVEVRANVETIFVHVNASDDEDIEQLLRVFSIEWRENNSLNQNPPVDPWHVDSTKLNINLDEGYNAIGGYIMASISPSSTAFLGEYDIRVSVVDMDGADNNWWYMHNAFTVVNPEPTLIDIRIQEPEVFRGNTIYITLNASDLGQSESDLTVEFQYRMQGSVSSPWTSFTVSPDMYDSSGGGFWKIPFSPGLDWDDDKLGSYEFQGRVKNDAGAYSDGGAWRKAPGSTEVKNIVPEAKSLGTDSSTVERSSTIVIYAVGDDKETSQDDLIVVFEYSSDGGSNWGALEGEDYNNGQTRWEVDFTPDPDADIGTYDFRVRFFDGKHYSDYIEQQNLVDVVNAVPEVTSLGISDDTAFRTDPVTLTAEVTDADEDIEDLTPNFQYQGPGESSWISQSASNYFGSASVQNGKWIITFTAPTSADIGDYNFRVVFTDSAGDTSEDNAASELLGGLTLENSEPEVSIDSPSAGSRSPGKLDFEATGFDQEDSDLNWLWDFGDGETSTDESPSHEYAELGDYTITVTVTDDDGSTAEDEIVITIKGEPEGDSMPLVFLILILVIVVVLVLVLLLAKKKKKPEAAAPPAYDTSTQPEVPQPPTAQPPGQPGAQPIPEPAAQPAPAAGPMAASAAAPTAAPAQASAGQMIKCPKCATPFPVTSTERPLTIECPNCGAKGTLN
jgi:PKD repeat protein